MNNYQQLTAEIQKVAGKLLADGKVDKLIGFTRDEYSGEVTPVFIEDEAEAVDLVFDQDCGLLLAKYLLNYPEEMTIGIVAKPCDSRAIAAYLAEGMVNRKKLTIIGINGCPGIANNTACDRCTVRNPVLADITVGKPLSREDLEQSEDREESPFPTAEELEAMPAVERKAYFQEEFSRCIRCYACREACYACYCPECFTDSNQPFWVGESTGLEDNYTFHLMRAMHMAGRCIDCGACELACPEGINVRALAAHLNRAAVGIYDYQAGMDPDQKTLLTDYDVTDSQPGFLD